MKDFSRTKRGHLTQAEVARLLGMTRARVSQIEQAALAKLRRHPAIKEIAESYGLFSKEK